MTKGSYAAAAATAGVVAGAYCAYHLYNKTKKCELPTNWKKAGNLEAIFMYPLKSSAGIEKNTAECTFLGLKDGWLRDRILMVVDDNYNSVTARAFPKLLLVQTTISNSTVTLQCKGMEPLDINLEQVISMQLRKDVTMWCERFPAYECGWQSNEWFSRYLKNSSTGFRLVLFRESENKILKFMSKKTDRGAFSDEMSFNLINQASMDELNTRLNGVKVNHRYFRTNFLLSGSQAYEEDNWKFIKIGENIFEIIKPCTRCIMTTNNPETAERNPNVEPLKTLRSYRQETDVVMRRYAGNSPRFGVQMALRSGNGGIVSTNDPIYVA